jgi:1,2-diacylglycerol 3-beta-glucosyltransferase
LIVLDIIQIASLVVVFTFLIYLVLLTILASMAKNRSTFPVGRFLKFAVVIPAHNEEDGIEMTMRSVMNIEYPRERFAVVVIADNCSDKTADKARAMGGTVMERNDPLVRGKGHALRWGFDRLLAGDSGFDAIVVIDADSVVSANFLTVMNWYCQDGASVLQASDLVAPQSDAWNAQMTRIGFLLYNYVRPLGRRLLGGSAGLRGNGMCFTTSTLKAFPWAAFSINEDLEYGLHLLLKGVKVTFAPEAAVLATMPVTAKNAESQRARWEGGRFGLIRSYFGPLLRRTIRERSVASLDALLDLITPALVNLIALAIVLTAGTYLGAAIGAASWMFYGKLWLLALALGCFHLFSGLRIAQADSSVYRALLHIPRYAFWKLKVYGAMPMRWSHQVWVRTPREP